MKTKNIAIVLENAALPIQAATEGIKPATIFLQNQQL